MTVIFVVSGFWQFCDLSRMNLILLRQYNRTVLICATYYLICITKILISPVTGLFNANLDLDVYTSAPTRRNNTNIILRDGLYFFPLQVFRVALSLNSGSAQNVSLQPRYNTPPYCSHITTERALAQNGIF